MPLDPASEAVLAATYPPDLSIPDFRALEPAHVRSLLAFAQPVAAVEDRLAGGVPVRIYTPFAPGPRPLIVLFHGGGWVVGSIATHDVMARDLCLALGAVVVSADYRRAPEDPFPAAVNDARTVLEWAAGSCADLAADAGRIIVAGDSAGGNLAAAVAVGARDLGAPRLAAQLLIHPVLDAAAPFHPTPDPLYPSRRDAASGFGATSEQLERYVRMYLPDPRDAAKPLASPLLADAAGLAPAVIVTAEYDPVRDDGLAFAARLKAAGVPVTARCWDGAIHGLFGPAGSTGLPQRIFLQTMADLEAMLARVAR